jgi:hypothetical protein
MPVNLVFLLSRLSPFTRGSFGMPWGRIRCFRAMLFLQHSPPSHHIAQFLHIKLLILVPHPLLARLFTPSGMTRQSSLSLHSSLASQS